MAFVLDASVCAVWALADEESPLADRAIELLNFENALVPGIWWFEIRNALLICERRKRLSVDGSNAFLALLDNFSILVDPERDQQSIFRSARKYQLSFYDAAYLDVARRHRIPLATLDKALRAAAEADGVSLLA